MSSRRVSVRRRAADDVDPLVAVLAQVQALDAYPVRPGNVRAQWVLGDAHTHAHAWVAELDGAVVGHVALAPRGAQEAEVTRFFVGPAARGTGCATALLDVAEAAAAGAGDRLVLTVVAHNLDAVRLYERRGWRRVRTYRAEWFGPGGPWPQAHDYVLEREVR
ncbi:GNAT family N-acetyltransferase [Cellulomonas sp. PhB143]|uniref:GNAT family N-acetyltransferase n=1 Tax=Cellulomonas sp. PhB143 TaxID=2485186 RepID=UPI000F49FC96|nr:GNAT family N-acetyltransferase [Cellulomonas sp. PhB143]ROS78461.1 acetyltransferase (GNAT) family protein [Cellulomonas sp. PhB143]